MGFEACIVGIGTSDEFGFDLGKSPLRLQTEAFVRALSDAGLEKSAIDGFITAKGMPNGVDYEEFVIALGLDIRWATQLWAHGRWATNTVLEAAMVVEARLADYVVIANSSVTARGYGRFLRDLGGAGPKEGLRDVGGGHGEWDIHGVDTPGSATALVARSYMQRYGATAEDLARIPMNIREHATRNPMAIMRGKPMGYSDYLAEPMIVEPFRRPDYCLSSEGATALIVTSPERARDLASPAVRIVAGQGLLTSRDDYILFARKGMGVGISQEGPLGPDKCRDIYERGELRRSDISALYAYDSFSSNIWMVLERFGFCREGEAWQYVSDVGLQLGSPLPVNTNGGLLSEAHLLGYGHLIEMVRQLRGTAGERQLSNVRALQWATPRGDSVILGL
jgi:acetyl-CoA acetyltransferase